MRHKEIGQIDEGLWLFGTEESCVYLLEGDDSSALISAGISYIIPDILRQIATWKRSQRKIRHIIILHSHFDHIGIVPYLKRIQPDLNIYASERAWKILSNPKAASVMEDYTLKVCKRVRGNTDDLAAIDWQWRQDIFGDSLRQGSRIELGGRHIEFHESPGHSSCSLTAYVPELKALFPSDAVAIPYRDEYVIAAGSSFDEYKKSLDRLGCLDVEIIGADHYGYITKSEARQYIARSKEAAEQMISTLKAALEQFGNIHETALELVKNHYERRPDYFVAPEILVSTYTQMLKQFLPLEDSTFI